MELKHHCLLDRAQRREIPHLVSEKTAKRYALDRHRFRVLVKETSHRKEETVAHCATGIVKTHLLGTR